MGLVRSPEQLGEGLSLFCLIHAPGRQVGKQVDLGGAQICIERAVIRKAVRRSLGFDNRPDRGVAGKQLSPSGDESQDNTRPPSPRAPTKRRTTCSAILPAAA